jgi:WD40 repeat protein
MIDRIHATFFLTILMIVILSPRTSADLVLGPEELVQAGGTAIVVLGYSVPSFVDWNNDGLKDLIVGEGGGGVSQGKVRVYLNTGTVSEPQFGAYFYAQSNGNDLVTPTEGCQGAFPRVIYWDADERKDLLIGQATGTITLYLNNNTDEDPRFDGGRPVQVGNPGSKIDIDVGSRATSTVVDWNNDGKRDLVVGALDGKVRVFINQGSDTSPDYRTEQFVQDAGADLVVSSQRSSPHVEDFDDDGKKDLLSGNTEGQLVLYVNAGSDEAPTFSGYTFVEADSVTIDLADLARSRLFVCDWNDDGFLDVLVGASDSRVHLYRDIHVYTAVPKEELPRPERVVRLLPARPNPFNQSTAIHFELARDARVRLDVYDAAGRKVRTLLDHVVPVGYQAIGWNGRDDAGADVAAGIYFVRLWTAETVVTTRVALIR